LQAFVANSLPHSLPEEDEIQAKRQASKEEHWQVSSTATDSEDFDLFSSTKWLQTNKLMMDTNKGQAGRYYLCSHGGSR